uniref:Putative protease Do-like 14 n=1 Tax=Aegilops tauschii TaxID=37682 RepID=M8B1B0_AEGTA
MTRSHGEGREEDRPVACETGPRKKARKGKRGSAKARPPPPAPSQEHRATTSDDDGSAQVRAMVAEQMRDILAVDAAKKKKVAELRSSAVLHIKAAYPHISTSIKATNIQSAFKGTKRTEGLSFFHFIANLTIKGLSGERDLSVEDTFGDSNDGSLESLQARKVALLVSKSVVSLSSFAGGKRIRVCSGFVMHGTDNTGANMILTSATLVRSLNGDSNVISDVTVKVLLPDGHITDGHIFLVDFHYNVAVVKIAAYLALLEEGTTNNGAVLALGRAYEGGLLMCSRGQVVNKKSKFGCAELLVSSCKVSMAGSGGPLVNYNGQVLGINFYEKNQTSYLPMLIVSRILEQHHCFGKLISPWLGLRYSSLHMVPLAVLEPIYQKFPDVDQGLYVSKVVEGSPADVAGLRVGDVLVKCGDKLLSSVPEFGAMLLDDAKAHSEAFGGWAGDMTIEVVIKRQRDGSTVSKTIAAEMLRENNYNRQKFFSFIKCILAMACTYAKLHNSPNKCHAASVDPVLIHRFNAKHGLAINFLYLWKDPEAKFFSRKRT